MKTEEETMAEGKDRIIKAKERICIIKTLGCIKREATKWEVSPGEEARITEIKEPDRTTMTLFLTRITLKQQVKFLRL